MGWASKYIEKLQTGETVSFRPHGHSMSPRIESGRLCTVAPAVAFEVGDIVLCKVKGREYLHIVKAISDGRVQIGNNRGYINGWTARSNVFGVLVRVEK